MTKDEAVKRAAEELRTNAKSNAEPADASRPDGAWVVKATTQGVRPEERTITK